MAAQFSLSWDNTVVNASGNSTGQTASHRLQSVGGAFSSAGYTPANPMAKSVNAALSPDTLEYNKIYEFRVDTECTVNGPTINSNGLVEQIAFNCLGAGIFATDVKVTIVLDVTGLDILRAKFQLYLSADDTLVQNVGSINRVGDSITAIVTGLTPETEYYWQIELGATINGVNVWSGALAYLNELCTTSSMTSPTIECPAPDTLTVVKP